MNTLAIIIGFLLLLIGVLAYCATKMWVLYHTTYIVDRTPAWLIEERARARGARNVSSFPRYWL